MDLPPAYKEVVIETNAVPSAPSYARVFGQTAQEGNALFGDLEWKEIRQGKRKHFSEYDERETSNIANLARATETEEGMGPRGSVFDKELVINQDLEISRAKVDSKQPWNSQKQKPTKLDVRYLERQKRFSNRVSVHDYSERFQDEENDCNTVVGEQSSSKQAVSIPQRSFVGNRSSQNETILNQAQMGRYFYRKTSEEEQEVCSPEQENGEKGVESGVITVQPNKSPVSRTQSLSPVSPKYTKREKRRESYIYSETGEIGVQTEPVERNTTKKLTRCFVNICFCMSCRCAVCSTSCSCTLLHCVPCLAYSVLCCPFWFVCLFCSFINPCWKEILLVTSGALKHLAFSCKSVGGKNCSFTCLADDVEETLWNSKRWGCGFEETEEI